MSKDAYPELAEKQEHIFATLNTEEENFNKTIDQGLSILNAYVDEMKAKGEKTLSGEHAFKLYDTYGFPLDLTVEILEESGFAADKEGFKACMQEQRERARKARKTSNYMGADATVYEQIDVNLTTEFVGYDTLVSESEIIAIADSDAVVESLSEGQEGSILTKETPFYATMGGQCGDAGVIETATGRFVVKDTIKVVGGKIAHIGYVENGEIKLHDTAKLAVDADKRIHTCMNHSATHLLQKALKTVLGGHVEQAGSYVDQDRLRFDFTHNQAMTKEEIAQVEAIVNEKIAEDLPVVTKVMGIEEAKKTGAMALFGEKYGETVRVVNMGDFSIELCGGTHVAKTGVIATFKIVSETGVAAGVRRIEALTSRGAFAYYHNLENTLKQASIAAKAEPANLVEKIEGMLAEIKQLQSENQKLKAKAAKAAAGNADADTVTVGNFKVLPMSMNDVDMNALRNLGDDMKAKIGSGVVILASEKDGKANLIVMATDDAVKAGVHAGNIIKAIAPIVGGGGGGRPNMAQAGGKNPREIMAAVAAGLDEVKKQLS